MLSFLVAQLVKAQDCIFDRVVCVGSSPGHSEFVFFKKFFSRFNFF